MRGSSSAGELLNLLEKTFIDYQCSSTGCCKHVEKTKIITDRQHVTKSTQRYRLLPLKTQKALFYYIFLMHIIVLQIEIVTNSIVCILAVRFKLEDCDLSINTMCLYENPTPFWLKIWAKRIFE